MMAAAKATGDANYMKYVTDRFNFLAEVAPHFRELQEKSGQVDPQMKQILTPHALDDAGAVCAAMIKAQLQDQSLNLYPLIDNYLDFILNQGIPPCRRNFRRIRPQYNTLWLDDMFMGVRLLPGILNWPKIISPITLQKLPGRYSSLQNGCGYRKRNYSATVG